MSSVLTNRLVGSAILIVAAIVFLPDVLDGQKQVRKDDFKAVPERPEFAEVTAPQTFNADQHQAETTQAAALPVENRPALDSSTDPVPADPNGPQVGTMEKPLEVAGMTSQVTTAQSTQPQASTPAATTTGSLATTAVDANTKQPDTAAVTAEPTKILVDPLKQTEAELASEAGNSKPLSKTGYMVKVGAFGKEANANALITKLKAAGLTTFTRKVVNSQGVTMIAVFVGPDLKKDKLEKALPQIQQISNTANLRVSNYQPLEN